MKIDNIEVHTGGKFDMEQIIKNNAYMDENGKMCVGLGPELYNIVIENQMLEKTRQLSNKEIKSVCNFWKKKFIILVGPDDSCPNLYMDVDHVTYDSNSNKFKIFSTVRLICDEDGVTSAIGTRDERGYISTDLPPVFNDMFIEKDDVMIVDYEEFLDLLIDSHNSLVRELNPVDKLLDELYDRYVEDNNKWQVSMQKNTQRSNKKPSPKSSSQTAKSQNKEQLSDKPKATRRARAATKKTNNKKQEE